MEFYDGTYLKQRDGSILLTLFFDDLKVDCKDDDGQIRYAAEYSKRGNGSAYDRLPFYALDEKYLKRQRSGFTGY